MSEQTGRWRETVRRIARKNNGFGFFCSWTLRLVREGPAAAGALFRFHRMMKRYARQSLRSLQPPEKELERQRAEAFSPAPLFSITVPLYNTPEAFLTDLIRSVRGQTYGNWELCLADGSDAEHGRVESLCREQAAADPRIRYRKLDRNGGISENSNAALDMARGDYIVLLDHDDLLVPGALYENARVIRETGADFIYSDEAVFASPDPKEILEVHRKPEYTQERLLESNFICHLTVFRKSLLGEAGRFRSAYDGSQDHDLFLRLTDRADRVAHIPVTLYFWRSHAGSVAGDIGAKYYAVEAGQRAVRDFLREKRGVEAEVTSSERCATIYTIRIPGTGEDRETRGARKEA